MFVVHVIPLWRGTNIESLSYFSSLSYPAGSLLEVPVRGKSYRAVVVDVEPVATSKATLKSASFSLHKLPKQEGVRTLPESLLATARELARIYPAPEGAILFELLPPDVRNGDAAYPEGGEYRHNEETTPSILTARADERIVAYRSHIRSVFAHRGSVLFVVPTARHAARAAAALSLGIEERVVVFSAALTPGARAAAYAAFADTTLTKLVIATPSFAYLERADLLSIIVEESASAYYCARARPYIDHRRALIAYAKAGGRSIIFGGTIPRAEDEAARREERFLTLGETAKRLAFPASLSIVRQKDKPTTESPFTGSVAECPAPWGGDECDIQNRVVGGRHPTRKEHLVRPKEAMANAPPLGAGFFTFFSKELLVAIKNTLEARGRVFIYGARRGLSSIVVCVDCGFIFRCPDSHTPYSLLRTYNDGQEERWFVSSTSGRRVRAADVCEVCGSWRLRECGIGIQQVFDECKTHFPKEVVTLFDSTTATTRKRAMALIEDFYSHRGGILVGTAMTLPYLERGVDLSAVVSFDAARTLPTWRADEWVFGLLLHLRELSRREVVVQIRAEPDNLLHYAARGALERFFDDELGLRKLLGYPPFVTLVLLSWSGPGAVAHAIEHDVKAALKDYHPHCYSHPHSTTKKTLRHALLRLPAGPLPDKLLSVLRSLPPYIKIEIDPNRII
jgi:primosomal protein N'